MTTLVDIKIPSGVWTDVHAAYSLAAGTALIVQNKTSYNIALFVGTSPPPDNSGMLVMGTDYSMLSIAPASSEKLFIKSLTEAVSTIGVQV